MLLGDVEGSVRLWEADRDAMTSAVKRLDELVATAADEHSGARPVEQGEGDSFVLAFAQAQDALRCALDLQQRLAAEPWPGGVDLRMRMAIHTGDVALRNGDNYAGPTINRCARLRDLGHGGQVVLSQASADLVVDHLPPGTTLRDLGPHRLRDLARPERIYQLCAPDLQVDFPPLRSLDGVPNNLSAAVTSFVGRSVEMTEIQGLLGRHRLVTLTGSGGAGKTRLALHAAADIAEAFPHGVWWFDLAPLSDAHLVPAAIASTLSLADNPTEDLVDAIVDHLGTWETLLVFDNCEHLVDACARLVQRLLAECPSVVVLATSREALAIDGEAAYPVPSLAVPSPDDDPAAVASSDAVHLFVERAAQVRPGFEVTDDNAAAVSEICRRLDGIPLAIELAAARTRVLSPAQIAEGLADRFRLLTGGTRTAMARQRTLEASVSWSYQLLSDAERTVLNRLSAFAGGCTLEAAEAVTGFGAIERYDVLDIVSTLVDRSLVQFEEAGGRARYRILETIRAFGMNELVASGEAEEVRDRHLRFFVSLTDQAGAELQGTGFAKWLERLDADLDNLRAAGTWAIQSGQIELLLRLESVSWLFSLVRGRYAEGRRNLEAGLADPSVTPAVRAYALTSAASFCVMGGDVPSALTFVGEAVDIARTLENPLLLAHAMAWCGWALVLSGTDVEGGRRHIDEALALAREIGEPGLICRALSYQGVFDSYVGSLGDARRPLEESITIADEHGYDIGLVPSLVFVGTVDVYMGAFGAARQSFERALERAVAIDYRAFEAYASAGLGLVGLHLGDYDIAWQRMDRSFAVADRHRLMQFGALALLWRGRLELAIGNLDAAAASLDEAERRFRQVGAPFNLSEALVYRALAAIEAHDLDTARQRVAEVSGFSGGNRRFGQNAYAAGRLARAEGDTDAAIGQFHESLAAAAACQAHTIVVDALEALAGASSEVGDHEFAARLFGAAERLRRELGYVRFPVERAGYEVDLDRVRCALGGGFDVVFAEGVGLTEGEAVAYARRGWGERRRPTTGWASLTPTEVEVARLVADGLSNPEIAARLFVSRNTVKTHLSHIYTKLGIASRAELASEATKAEA